MGLSAALKNTATRAQHGGFAGRSALSQRLARPTTPLGTENDCPAVGFRRNSRQTACHLGNVCYDPIELVQDIHKRLLFAVRARHIAALRRVIPELDDEMAARLMGLAILHMCLAPFRMDNLAKPAYRFGSDVADHLVDAVVREGAAGILSVARKIRSGAIVRVV